MAAAQRCVCPDVQSSRLGLTVAQMAGGGPSATWWSSTRMSAWVIGARVAAAAVPQSTQTMRVAPWATSASSAGVLGP